MPTDEWRRCGSWMNTRRPQLAFERSRGVLQRQRATSSMPRRAQDEAMTALTPLAVTYSLEAPASRNGPLPPTGAPGEPVAVARGRAAPAAMPQHSNPPPESSDPHAPPRARQPARVIDRRSNKCAPRSDTHRSSTTDATSYPQRHGAPPEYPVTDTYKQQSPRPRRYQ